MNPEEYRSVSIIEGRRLDVERQTVFTPSHRRRIRQPAAGNLRRRRAELACLQWL